MVGASKILTVSYGTFSCTLEGFDDPFSTMKAIAEYFRELAAEDRYFGAEPPTPDAEMLHRIAEREIQRRVEAKIGANGVVLRQEDSAAPEPAPRVTMGQPAAPAAGLAEQAEAAGPATSALLHVAAQIAAGEATPAEDSDTETPALRPAAEAGSAEAESVAAKLMRIRAAVAGSRTAAPEPAEAVELASEPATELAADTAAADAAGPAEAEFTEAGDWIPEDWSDAAPEAEMLLAEVPEARAQTEELAHTEDSAQTEEPVQTEDEAAMLDGLAASLAEDAAEDLLAGDRLAADDLAADDLAGDEALAAEAFAAEEFAARLVAAEAEPEIAEIAALRDLTQGFAAEPAAPVLAMAEPAESTDLGFVAASLWPDRAAMDDAEDDAENMAAWLEAEAEETPRAQEDRAAPDALPEALAGMLAAEAAAAEPQPEPEPQREARSDNALQRARARVIKVRRIEVAEQPAPKPAPAADPVLSGIEAALGETGLSAEDEADLMAELAAVEREAVGTEAAPKSPVQEPEAQPVAAPQEPELGTGADADRPVLGRGPADEAAVSRLIETANTRLEGSETRRRFSAIAHLKAAVAATVADRALRTEAAGTALAQDSEEAIDRYREDLTKAVRPRRPGEEAASAQTPRPGNGGQQAPLVLVSEQRVDRQAATQPQDLGAIRPRRVTASTLRLTERIDTDEAEAEEDVPAPTPEEARSFADFAGRLGANGLADLLEAAAAYTAAVEGRPHFSRPQIIKKVAHLAEETDYSREASLRSFGMLLREGKIQKVKRGQFAISDNSRFMSEARRAAR